MEVKTPFQSSLERDLLKVENRAVRAIYDYWLGGAGERWAPAWRDLDLMALPGPLLPYVLVCDVRDDGELVYRYWGRGHTSYHGKDYSGMRVNEVSPDWVRDLLNHQYTRVIETKMPKLFETRYEGVADSVFSVRLPLSDDAEQVTGVLSLAERGGVEPELAKWVEAQRRSE